MAYQYSLDNRTVIIGERDNIGRYIVVWDGFEVGYLFVGVKRKGRTVRWFGSTYYLNKHASAIGTHIDGIDRYRLFYN